MRIEGVFCLLPMGAGWSTKAKTFFNVLNWSKHTKHEKYKYKIISVSVLISHGFKNVKIYIRNKYTRVGCTKQQQNILSLVNFLSFKDLQKDFASYWSNLIVSLICCFVNPTPQLKT